MALLPFYLVLPPWRQETMLVPTNMPLN